MLRMIEARVRVGRGVAALTVLGLAACATKPPEPPPAPVVAAIVERPPAVRPAPPPKPIDLRWTFAVETESCTALASGPGTSLQIRSTNARQILVLAKFSASGPVTAGSRPARLTFEGPAGAWTLQGTWQRREFASTQALDEHGVASVLGLLAGGTVTVTAGTRPVGLARLPPSNAEGNAWVQCPKQMVAAR